MNKSQSVKQNKKHLKPSSKAQDPSNVGYEEISLKVKKKYDHFIKRHANIMDPYILECAYDKRTEEKFCCLDEWILE